MNNSDLLKDLLNRMEQGSTDPSDYEAIRDMIAADESGELAAELHDFHSTRLTTDNKIYDFTYWQSVLNEILAADKPVIKKESPLVRMSRSRWWIAAAAVIVLFSAGYFLLTQKTLKQPPTTNRQPPTDILPGGNKAVLTLGNGSRIILDSMQNGSIAQQGNTNIIKTDSGKLAYLPTANRQPPTISYNTLSTPRGGQFQLTLPDGTKVWLNAASSITYPTAFAGNERKVTITGEAYFEVTHNPAMPFFVKSVGQEIKVLGTHFNVNAYSDESAVKTTLFQGSVKVTSSKTDQSLVIAPGQQTDLNDEQLSLIKNVNMDEVISWKEGVFHFESADLKTILRQFARWYNVEVVYDGTPTNRKFFGIVKRSNSLKRVLEMLKDNNIEYRIEGNRLIVKSS